jgi:hypothetical protein
MRPSVVAAERQAADPDVGLAIADVPEAPAIADTPANPAPVAAQRYVGAPVVKRRIVRTENRRGYSGAYAQYGGGSRGWLSMGSPYHF